MFGSISAWGGGHRFGGPLYLEAHRQSNHFELGLEPNVQLGYKASQGDKKHVELQAQLQVGTKSHEHPSRG